MLVIKTERENAMKYVEKNLRENEKIIIEAKIKYLPAIISCLFSRSPFLIIGIIFAALGMAVGGIFFIVYFLTVIFHIFKLKSICLALTDKRLIGKIGVFSVKFIDVMIDKIDNVFIQSGFWGKIFKYYTIKICSVSSTIEFKKISNAQEFKNAVTDLVDERRKGLH